VSKRIDDGGSAFPTLFMNGQSGEYFPSTDGGMSLRDYFAAKALAAMLANPDKDARKRGASGLDYFPAYAYEYADAMLRARKA
jgi:hypothetical protein